MTKSELKRQLKEESTTAAVGGYNSKFAFGNAKNYYLKLGYKLVNQEKLRKNAKGYVAKDLWK